jgi:Tat protein translocase TatB subunit
MRPDAGRFRRVFNIGPEEIILILVVALVFLGPNRLPEVARQIGKGLREFRSLSARAQKELMDNVNLNADGITAPLDYDLPSEFDPPSELEPLEFEPSSGFELPPASNGKPKKAKGKTKGATRAETEADGYGASVAAGEETVTSASVDTEAIHVPTVLGESEPAVPAQDEADADPIERSG